MDTGLKGKTVLITGAGRNVGQLAADYFAREGANLVICTSTKMQGLEETAAMVRKRGCGVVAVQCDVTDAAQVEKMVEAGVKVFGGIDVAVNNAVYRSDVKGAGFLEQPYEIWQRNIDVNLNGPYHICRAVIPHMKRKGWGRIVNFSGIAPFRGEGAAKAMVKIGIVGFTRGLATEFAPHGITANCISPGYVWTPLVEKQIPDTMKAWVLGNPGELKLTQKPVPVPKRAEVLVRIDAVAICAMTSVTC